MTDFKWHKMADGRPQDEEASYLLLGNGGGLYIARGFTVWNSGNMSFYVPNNRKSYFYADSIKAWALIPEFDGGSDD